MYRNVSVSIRDTFSPFEESCITADLLQSLLKPLLGIRVVVCVDLFTCCVLICFAQSHLTFSEVRGIAGCAIFLHIFGDFFVSDDACVFV